MTKEQTAVEQREGLGNGVTRYDTMAGVKGRKNSTGLPPYTVGRIISLIGVYAFAIYLLYSFISGMLASFK
ncbi:hypothetical protein [Paenibacillus xerothermodurans]|uniref:Uncharacterized protein n=1 Tax=Paenibacillus xerothermodurans TaxID=1977292 RepID=A0A2W1N5B8_PAEXE|nr:hypothetical protein [Paenibacillus xerothermodurans]PZE19577.1 hypothetical protein CBW46_017835 [Paenibacillus xerothermodurans]